MTTATSRRDKWAFDIQLNTGPEDRGFHGRNKKGEIQRPDIVDDICQGLLVQARIDRIVHGTETTVGHPASLIVLASAFTGLIQNGDFELPQSPLLFGTKTKRMRTTQLPSLCGRMETSLSVSHCLSISSRAQGWKRKVVRETNMQG